MAVLVPDAVTPGLAPAVDRLLLGVSGSAAVLSLPDYVATFRSFGVRQIVAVATHSACRLLPAEALALLCDKVYTDETGAGQHMSLARWAQAVLVLPATAHSLGCIATGLAPNLLTTTILATQRPVMLAPAMNIAMWRSRAVQRNVADLRADQYAVIDPVPGQAWEVATKSFVETLVLPGPAHVMAMLSAEAEGANT